jgi:hypothetical protein
MISLKETRAAVAVMVLALHFAALWRARLATAMVPVNKSNAVVSTPMKMSTENLKVGDLLLPLLLPRR